MAYDCVSDAIYRQIASKSRFLIASDAVPSVARYSTRFVAELAYDFYMDVQERCKRLGLVRHGWKRFFSLGKQCMDRYERERAKVSSIPEEKFSDFYDEMRDGMSSIVERLESAYGDVFVGIADDGRRGLVVRMMILAGLLRCMERMVWTYREMSRRYLGCTDATEDYMLMPRLRYMAGEMGCSLAGDLTVGLVDDEKVTKAWSDFVVRVHSQDLIYGIFDKLGIGYEGN